MKKDPVSGKIKKLKSRLAFVLLFFLLCNSVTAQEALLKTEYSYRRYTTQDGLPQMLAMNIFQDSRGFIWTHGNTPVVSRFDGFSFKNFNLEENCVFLSADENNNVKIYTKSSIVLINRHDSIKTLSFLPDSLHIEYAASTHIITSGYFVVSSNAGHKYLYRDNNNVAEEVLRSPHLDEMFNDVIYPDLKNGKIYISGRKRPAMKILDMHTLDAETIPLADVRNFCHHSVLGILAVASDGIYVLKGKNFSKIAGIALSDNATAIELKDGSLIVWDRTKVFRYIHNTLTKLVDNSATYFTDFMQDREGNFWLTSKDGIWNFLQFNLKNINLKNELVLGILEDSERNFWLGTLYGNLYCYNPEKEIITDVKYPLLDNKVNNFNERHCKTDETLYFTVRAGILMKRNNVFSWAKLPVQNSARNSFRQTTLTIDKKHIITLTYEDVYLCDLEGNPVRHFSAKNDWKQDRISHILPDSKGRWIVSGNKGLSIVKDSTALLVENGGMQQSSIELQENIFSCSATGLNILRDDTLANIYNFGENENIQDVKPYKNKYILVSASKVFYILDMSDFFKTGNIGVKMFNHNSGLNAYQLLKMFIDSQGLVWLSTTESIISFNPETLMNSKSVPDLHLLSFKTSSDNVHWTAHNTGLRIGYRDNNVLFSFIGLSYSAAENVRYHYRLPGFQNEWSDPVKTREVTFNNLPPGDYTFEIYADAGTEESRSKTESFTFSIKPAFWQTSWFLILLILSLVSLSFLLSLVFLQKKNRALLEKLHTEKELNELRISSIRLKAIPHFNANVLAAIEYYIANRTKEEAMRILGIYSSFTLKTLSDIDKAARPLSEELDYVRMYLDLEKIRFLEKFDFQINVEDGVDENVQLPNMILHTYCENAVKHGLMPLKSGGRLSINVSQQGQTVCVDVEDNGVGRESAARNPHLHSTKQGLSILNRQIEIYNRFNSEKIQQHTEDLSSAGNPAGTRFTVEIPLTFTYIT